MTDTNADPSRSEASLTAPNSPARCRFKKVLLAGKPPRKSAVEALIKSLESRGVLGPPEERLAERAASRRAPETAESGPEAVSESGALATVVAFSSPRKKDPNR
ncbi:MAG TPA: hypothetical protein VFZ57_04995 [Thermoanaerobaculia bacterium]|nr:hypothetical protein [Thermoanaerobaculia bacterium]